MSQWCNKCNKIPYDSDCNDKCPVFGLDFEELAEKYLALVGFNKELEDEELIPDDCLYIKGFLKRNYDGIFCVSDSADGYDWHSDTIITMIENYAERNGFFRKTTKGLGGRKSLIENCNIRVYFTEKECSLYMTQITFDAQMYGGDLRTEVSYVGYSEWTITGLDLDEFTIGGHDLSQEFGGHIGEYVHMIIECK